MAVSPCCMSTTRASKPWRAMISAVKPWEIESQPMLIHRPSRQICFILFGRTISPHSVGSGCSGMGGWVLSSDDAAVGEVGDLVLGIAERGEDVLVVLPELGRRAPDGQPLGPV